MTDRGQPAEDSSGENAASDQEWIDAIRSGLAPEERTPAERAAFRARLEERIENRGWAVWQPWAATTAAGVAAALLWLVVLGGYGENTNRPDETLVASSGAGLLSYAYYETDYLASGESGDAFLSDEYQAIASAFDVP